MYPIDGGYSLRWFTPLTEVDLCGHATLASAHALWSEGHLDSSATVKFNTKSGWLSADNQDGWIVMNFPSQPVRPAQHVLPQLIKSLCCGGNIRSISKNDVNFLVEIQSEKALEALRPDFAAVAKLPAQGIIATAIADDDTTDFVSRYFAPAVGIDEDPVTGSAHASLAPYWQEKLGKDAMVARQISQRGGVIKVTCEAGDRVTVSGQAVTVMSGTLAVG